MAINTQNTKIAFKKGSQTQFDKLQSFTEGTLYLTDAGHLYYANGTAKDNIIEISNIHKIDSYGSGYTGQNAALNYLNDIQSPIIGDYYYLVPDNMLVYKDTNEWKQINPDTHLTPNSKIISITSEQNSNKAKIETSIKDSKNNTASGQFTVVGGTNINVALDPNDETGSSIIISNSLENTNTTYELKSATATTGAYLNLKGSDTSTPQQILVQGNKGISVTANGANVITISGHPLIDSIEHNFNGNGEFTTLIKYDASTSKTSSPITPIVKYRGTTATAYSASATFNSGVAELNVYSATAVDALIAEAKRSLNAMTYKGTIDQQHINDLINSTTNQTGDTYRVTSTINATISGGNINATTGDLIIFNGADNTTATASNLEVVPSGNETLLKVSGTTADNLINFIDSLNEGVVGGIAELGSIKFTNNRSTTENALIDIATTESTSGNFVINLQHGMAGSGTTVTPVASNSSNSAIWQQSEESITIPGVSKLIKDNNGHIVDVELQEYKVTDTHARIISTTPTVVNDATAGTAAITFGYSLSNKTANTVNETIKIASTTLKVNASANGQDGTYTVDLEWGTF